MIISELFLMKNIELTKIIKKIKVIINEIKIEIENKSKKFGNKNTENFQGGNKYGKDINEFSKLIEGFQINPMFITLRTCVKQFSLSKKLFESHFSEFGK